MMNKEKMKELLGASSDGIITAEQVTDAGSALQCFTGICSRWESLPF